MGHGFEHFKTITHHRHLVMKKCFKVGLYKQGLMHDLSKYSPVEFSVGAKYYQGTRSPNNAEREATGLSLAWLHHKGRNKHHFEYWIDYSLNKNEGMVGMKMPEKYVVEMVMDRIAACMVYMGDDYNDRSPLEYYEKGKGRYLMHPETMELLERLLTMLAEKGEDYTFDYIRKQVLHNK
ncbi:MAG: catalase [Lachnospiraceae bacterium]|nr:catalase [Lachnospiraceae bacterium]